MTNTQGKSIKDFTVLPINIQKRENKRYERIPLPLPKPPLAMTVLARRRQGKSTVVANLVMSGGYAKAFSEVLILSDTIDQDKTYSVLKKFPNVACHDIHKRPIDNELLKDIWQKQAARKKMDPAADLLIVFDDLGEKGKSRDMRAWMNRYFQLCRHLNISFISCLQSINNATSEQVTNTTSWIVFGLDAKALKKVSEKLATAEKDHKELAKYIQKNTVKKHSWVMINLEAEADDLVYSAYDPEANTFGPG
jgi:hypothetical protein